MTMKRTLTSIYEEKTRKDNGIEIASDVIDGLFAHLEVDYSRFKVIEMKKTRHFTPFKKLGYHLKAQITLYSAADVYPTEWCLVTIILDSKKNIRRVRMYLTSEDFFVKGTLFDTSNEKEIKQILIAGKLSK